MIRKKRKERENRREEEGRMKRKMKNVYTVYLLSSEVADRSNNVEKSGPV